MPEISIIIPTCNRGEILAQTLRGVREASRDLDAEILVVNDSKTSEVDVGGSGARLLSSGGAGAGGARNLGARHAHGKLLIFFDDDILVSRRNLRRTLELHREHPGAVINLNWTYPPEMFEGLKKTSFGRFIQSSGLTTYRAFVADLPWRDEGVFEVPKVTALYFSIDKSAFEAVGGFDEAFLNQGAEDDEFSRRVQASGRKMFIDASEFVLHYELDRLDLVRRLNRIKVGHLNKRLAAEMGMGECRMDYPPRKAAAYSLLSRAKPALLALAAAIPNSSRLDWLYFRIVGVLIAIVIFEAYHRRDPRLI